MTEHEIRQLLAVVMAYDNRKPGQATVMAWAEASRRGRWTLESAVDAVHGHFAESTDWLMPAHITQRLRRARQLPSAIGELTAGSSVPAEAETIRTVMDRLADKLGWQRKPEKHAAPPVECPFCHARPGRPCVRQVSRGHHKGELRPLSEPHASRIELAGGVE